MIVDQLVTELTELQKLGESDLAALLARIRRLEKDQEIQADLASRALREGVGRAVQSIGVVVDYLADRGLIVKADVQAYIERHFHMTNISPKDGCAREAIDVHGWLTWADSTRSWRERAGRPREPSGPRQGSGVEVGGGPAELGVEGESGRHRHVQVDPVEV